MSWQYYPDGLLRSLVDQGGERARYLYDANGNRTQALEATGVLNPGQTALAIDLQAVRDIASSMLQSERAR